MSNTEMPETIAVWRFHPDKADDWFHGGWSEDHDRKTTTYRRADLPPTREVIEAMVPNCELERIVWSAMVWARENPGPDEVPEYTEGGNSFAEVECRATVRRILSALLPQGGE